MVHPGGFEPPAHGLEVRCSILLSYECIIGAGEGNRTLATGLEGQGSTTELHPHIEVTINFKKWSGRRDSNSRPSPWQGDALPLSHFRIYCLVRVKGLEPPRCYPLDPKSSASAIPPHPQHDCPLAFWPCARNAKPCSRKKIWGG